MFTKLFTAALCVVAIDARRGRELQADEAWCDANCYRDYTEVTKYATASLEDTNPDICSRYPTNGGVSMYQTRRKTVWRTSETDSSRCGGRRCRT